MSEQVETKHPEQAAPPRQKVFAFKDGFDNFLSRIGLNNDNTLSNSTYTFNLVTRNRILLEAAYRGSWVVGSVIDSVADDMTRAGAQVQTSENFDLEQFNKAQTRLQIWSSLNTGLKWGRLYGGAVGVIQIEGQDLASPLDLDTIEKGQFKGIAIYDRWMLNPIMSPAIPSGPDMGLPEMYQIVSSAVQSLGVPNDANRKGQKWELSGIVNVHHTRCIRFIGILLPFYQAITEMFWGESILERLWDRLISFDNASMSSAQLVDRANLRTIGVEGLREIIGAGGEAQKGLVAMFEMIRLMQVNEGLTLIDKNDTFTATAYSFAGLADLLLQFAQQLSGATGIPLRRLFSQVPAGLGGDSGDADIRLYYDNINAQQEARLRRAVEVVYKILWKSTFGKDVPKDFDFEFTPLWQMDAKDKAEIGKSKTETTIAAYDAGLIPAHTAMKELRDSSGETGIFSNITDEEIAEAEAEPPPMPDEAPAASEEKSADPEKDKPSKESAKDGSFRSRIGRWLYGAK